MMGLEEITDIIYELEKDKSDIVSNLYELEDLKLDLEEAKYDIEKELDGLYERRNELWAAEREEELSQYWKAVL